MASSLRTQFKGYVPSFGPIFAMRMMITFKVGSAPAPITGGIIMLYLTGCIILGMPPNVVDTLPLIMVLDWLIARTRTSINIVGDSFVAAFVSKMCPDGHANRENQNDDELKVARIALGTNGGDEEDARQ